MPEFMLVAEIGSAITIMTWLAVIAGVVLVVAVIVPIVVGRFLSKDCASTCSIELGQSPEAVWKAINDFRAFPVSAKMCRKTELLPDVEGLPTWREDIGSSRIKVTTLESSSPSRLVRQMDDEVVSMKFRTQYDIEATDRGATLRLTAVGRIEDGTLHAPIFRFMNRVFNVFKLGQKRYLATIARHFNEKPVFGQD